LSRPVILRDKLKQLEELQKMAHPVLEDLFNALWHPVPVPTSYFELVCHLQKGRAQFRRWKVLVCREGTRQAWVMVQAHYPSLDLVEIAKKCPLNDDRQEVEPEDFFEQVMPAVRIFEGDCKLKTIIDDL
jgi:hypothetical protein